MLRHAPPQCVGAMPCKNPGQGRGPQYRSCLAVTFSCLFMLVKTVRDQAAQYALKRCRRWLAPAAVLHARRGARPPLLRASFPLGPAAWPRRLAPQCPTSMPIKCLPLLAASVAAVQLGPLDHRTLRRGCPSRCCCPPPGFWGCSFGACSSPRLRQLPCHPQKDRDVRPIAVGECLRRLVAKCLCQAYTE